MKRRLFCACAAIFLALCALWAVSALERGLCRTAPVPADVPAPSAREPVLAFLGDSTDPFAAAVAEALGPWAKERGWRLITYDCRGNPTIRTGQVDDLLRNEAPSAAVLCGLEGDAAWPDWAAALDGGGLTTVSLRRRFDPAETAGVTLAPPEDQPFAAVAAWLGPDKTVVLVADLPDDPAVETLRAGLEARGVTVAGYGACWGVAEYAEEYLDLAREQGTDVDAAVALSRPGAVGAKAALGDAGRVLCLAWDDAVAEDLARGRLDAGVEVPTDSALTALGQVLDGKTARPLTLAVRTRP